LVRIVHELDFDIGQHGPGVVHSHRIMRFDVHAAVHQHPYDIDGRRLPHVIGARLKRQPQHADGATAQDLQRPLKLLHSHAALPGVDQPGRLSNGHVVTIFRGDGNQRGRVLREARAAPSYAGTEKARPDARIQAHAAHDLHHVRADPLAEACNFVGETDLNRQESVRGVLYHLGAGWIRLHQRRRRARLRHGHTSRRLKGLFQDWTIELFHYLYSGFALGTYYDPIWIERIVQRKSFAKKFRIGRKVNVGRYTALREYTRNYVGDSAVRADGNGGLHDQRILAPVLQALSHFPHCLFNVAGVRFAVGLWRRADGDHNDVGVAYSLRRIGRKADTFTHLREQFLKPLFMNRALTFI